MKIYYDTEFLENGETIRLISIGMIREDGKSLYRIVDDKQLMEDSYEHLWLRKNVLNSLPILFSTEGIHKLYDHPDYNSMHSREQIAEDVKRFVLNTPNPELWAYYSAYDHVVLCQLFGRMLGLPSGFPMYTHDLKSEIIRLGNPQVPEQESGEHNALEDAKWNKMVHEYLLSLLA